jgi:hypothetical protein
VKEETLYGDSAAHSYLNRRIVSMLPSGIAKLGTTIRKGRRLFRLYAVVGEVG